MIQSPCIASCQLDEHKVCVGCYRHITEIVDWSSRSPAERILIMQKVVQRQKNTPQY